MDQTAIICLGNPGLKYEKTKHNFVYWVIDRYALTKKIIFLLKKILRQPLNILKNLLNLLFILVVVL